MASSWHALVIVNAYRGTHMPQTRVPIIPNCTCALRRLAAFDRPSTSIVIGLKMPGGGPNRKHANPPGSPLDAGTTSTPNATVIEPAILGALCSNILTAGHSRASAAANYFCTAYMPVLIGITESFRSRQRGDAHAGSICLANVLMPHHHLTTVKDWASFKENSDGEQRNRTVASWAT